MVTQLHFWGNGNNFTSFFYRYFIFIYVLIVTRACIHVYVEESLYYEISA